MGDATGRAFISCTPERLYARSGRFVASEAVAGTRPRGPAELRPGVNDAQLLQALHPTPAVCGRPRDPALGWLQEAEGFDRGYYAGPFGWISGAGAEWAVAIRSALVHPPQSPSLTQQQQQQTRLVDLFAGVGVVSGSEPAAEWAELDLK
ncbi:MR_MLE domain-containing protein, partial [Haematococcus lacustris]